MSQTEVSQRGGARGGKSVLSSEVVFKYINIAVVLILMFCVSGFLKFRQLCITKGYYVFLTESLIWCGIGFVAIFIAKYSYYHFLGTFMESIVHSKYVGEERIYKTMVVKKLSFDSVFYSATTILAYVLFREEYWFPSIVGGKGQCGAIYRQYPNWPLNSVSQLEIYYMIQLGIHAFSVFEMAVIKRKTQRKFYEFLLHHSVAVSLILFSMMCNEVSAGATILIIHDMSDILIAFGRFYVETKYDTNPLTITIMYIATTISWVYLRIIVFPFCILANVYANKPTIKDECYLLSVAFVLYGMHLFWTYFLIKIGVIKATKKVIKNAHDGQK